MLGRFYAFVLTNRSVELWRREFELASDQEAIAEGRLLVEHQGTRGVYRDLELSVAEVKVGSERSLGVWRWSVSATEWRGKLNTPDPS